MGGRYLFTYVFIYYEELVYEMMEAEKSHQLWSTSLVTQESQWCYSV